MSIASKQTEVRYIRIGKRGRLPYPAGEWIPAATYTSSDDVAPYVLRGGIYYVMNRTGSVTNVDPQADYAAYGERATWIPLEQYRAIFVELLMARLGLIGKSVFWDNYTISQQGVDAQGQPSADYRNFADGTFTPNILIDWVSGTMKLLKLIAEGAEISGTIRSTVAYSPFVRLDAEDVGNGGMLDPLKYGCNIVLGNYYMSKTRYVRLPMTPEYAGMRLLIYEPMITRMSGNTALVARFSKPGSFDVPTTFQPESNRLVELIAIPLNGLDSGIQWIVTNPDYGVFSNDY